MNFSRVVKVHFHSLALAPALDNHDFMETNPPALGNAEQIAIANARREALRAYIKRHGIRITAWAKEAGVAKGTLSSYFSDRPNRPLTLNQMTLEKLAANEKVSVAVLLGEEPDPRAKDSDGLPIDGAAYACALLRTLDDEHRHHVIRIIEGLAGAPPRGEPVLHAPPASPDKGKITLPPGARLVVSEIISQFKTELMSCQEQTRNQIALIEGEANKGAAGMMDGNEVARQLKEIAQRLDRIIELGEQALKKIGAPQFTVTATGGDVDIDKTVNKGGDKPKNGDKK